MHDYMIYIRILGIKVLGIKPRVCDGVSGKKHDEVGRQTKVNPTQRVCDNYTNMKTWCP